MWLRHQRLRALFQGCDTLRAPYRLHSSESVARSAPSSRCLLCDTPSPDWAAHMQSPIHVARAAICGTFINPGREASLMSHIQRHLQLDPALLDESAARKVQLRRNRLRSTILHLGAEAVLRDAVPYEVEETWHVRDQAISFALIGEGYARQEVTDRTARLMPNLGAAELHAVVALLLSTRQLAYLHDEMHVAAVVEVAAARERMTSGVADAECHGAMEPQLQETVASAHTSEKATAPAADLAATLPPLRRVEEKALVLLACLGELVTFQRASHTASVADKAAADAIVLHVLASHAVESVLAELIHGTLQRVVCEGTPVWGAYLTHQSEWKGQRATSNGTAQSSTLAGPLLLSPAPQTATDSTTRQRYVEGGASDAVAMTSQLQGFFPFRSAAWAIERSEGCPPPLVGTDPSGPCVHWAKVQVGLQGATPMEGMGGSGVPVAAFAPILPRLSPMHSHPSGLLPNSDEVSSERSEGLHPK